MNRHEPLRTAVPTRLPMRALWSGLLPPEATGIAFEALQAHMKILSGLYPGTHLKGKMLVVEMTDTTRYVFSTTNPSYDPGDEAGAPDYPTAAFIGNTQLPSTMGTKTPKFIHLCGSVDSYVCEDKTTLQAIIDGLSITFDKVLVGTYEIPGGEQEEYQGGQYLSAGITLESSDATV